MEGKLFSEQCALDSSMTRILLHLCAVITSYLHMVATVTTNGKDKEKWEKGSGPAADRTRPCPFLFHLEPFLSRPRGGFAGLEAGLFEGLL